MKWGYFDSYGEDVLSGDLFTAKVSFIRERRRAGQALSEDTETCIHGPYRKLGR